MPVLSSVQKHVLFFALLTGILFLTPLNLLADTFEEDYAGGGLSLQTNITVNRGETHTFRVDVGYTTGIDTDWYDTYSGGAVVEHDSNLSYTYLDPQRAVTFSSAGTFWVRAEMYDNDGNWVQAQRWQVTVVIPDTTAPSIPVLQTPSDGSSTSDQTPYFNWASSSDSGSGVSHYEIEVYDGDVSWGDISATVTSSDFTPSSNIPHDRIYWRVRAVDNVGNTSSWSSEWWFDLVEVNHPPEATRYDPSSSSISTTVGTNIAFQARGQDQDGNIDYADWTLSGPESDTNHDYMGHEEDIISSYSHTFNTVGNYTVRCVFTDEEGATDSVSWSVTIEPETGTILAYLKNQNGEIVDVNGTASPRFCLYTQSGSLVECKSGHNYENFDDVEYGGYWLEGYYTGTFIGEELWTSQFVQVPLESADPLDLIRDYPFASEVHFNDAGTTFTPPMEVPAGADIDAIVTVINNRNTAHPVKVSVGTSTTIGGTIDWNYDTNNTTNGWRTISANSEGRFTVKCDTSSTGVRYYVVKVETELDNGNIVLTDTWDWSASYVYDVVDNPGSINIDFDSLKDGNFNGWNTVRWESTGDVGQYVKIDLINILNDPEKTIITQTPNDGEMNWDASMYNDLVAGPYYRIRITSTDNPDINPVSEIFGLYTKDYGVTIITHGLQLGVGYQDVPEWKKTMASAIVKRAGKGTIFEYMPQSAVWQYRGSSYDSENALPWGEESLPGSLDDGEIVLMFNWSLESDHITTMGYSEAAGDALFAMLKASTFSNCPEGLNCDDVDLFNNLHFIGHSRGTIANSMAVRRILEYMPDVTIDQVTTLDPHPRYGADPWIMTWKQTDFADNYFRSDGGYTISKNLQELYDFWSSARSNPSDWQSNYLWNFELEGYETNLDFDGVPVQGAFNYPLDNYIGDYLQSIGHIKVHAWYFGTIDYLADQETEGGIDIPSSWYENKINQGFYYSRLGGGKAYRNSLDDNLREGGAIVNKSRSLPERYPIVPVFNGGFDDLDLFLGGLGQPGWGYHGGGLAGSVSFSDNSIRLLLDTAFEIDMVGAEHNIFFIPDDASSLRFEWKVLNGSDNDIFSVQFTPLNGSTIELSSSTIFEIDGGGWNVDYINIEDLRGKIGTLVFRIDAAASSSNSWIQIDNIAIFRIGIPNPELPDQKASIVGNLTPEFQWSAYDGDNTQSGYQLRVRCDDEVDPTTGQEIIVYDTGYIAGTAVNHTYSPGAYSGYDSVSECDRISLPLEYGKTYHWHVRYLDNLGNWSPWSSDTSGDHRYFYTVAPDNNDPILSNPAVTPTNGDTETDFEFTVHYYDQDGNVPQHVTVYINGISRTMQFKLGTGTETNGTYTFTTTLPAGNYSYKFKTQDVENGFDETGSIPGLVVDAIFELSVTPDSQSVNASAGTEVFTVDNTGSGTMLWTASVISGGDWLSITSGSSGTNSGTITTAFSANISGSPRSGTIRVTASGASGSPKYVTVVQSSQGDIIVSGWRYARADVSGSGYYPAGSAVLTDNTLQEKYVINNGYGSILTGDVTGDGNLELIHVVGNLLKIYNHSGMLLHSITLGSSNCSVTMLDDINGDGIVDIGIGTGGTSNLRTYFYDGQGNLLKTLSKIAGYDCSMRPNGLLGNGDLVVSLNAGFSHNDEHRGFAVYDKDANSEKWHYRVGPAFSITSIADFDGDGLLDFTNEAVTVHNGCNADGYNHNGTMTTDGDIWLIVADEQGNETLSIMYSSPSNGNAKHYFTDLNNDGIMEIIGFEAHDPTYYPGTSEIHLFGQSGAITQTFAGSENAKWSFTITDIDGNGKDEVVASNYPSGQTLYVLDDNLTMLDSTEVAGRIQLSSDLNGDGYIEVVLLDEDGNLRVVDKDLQVISTINVGSTGTVIASDMDRDGIVELICMTRDHGIHVFDNGKQVEQIKGDINADGVVDLEDALTALQVSAGLQPQAPTYLLGDVNNDGKIGLEEVLYPLRIMTGMIE